MKCLILIKQQATPQILEEMRDRIRNFLERLIAVDSSHKEFFWIINFKKKLMLKDGEYMNYINYDKAGKDGEKNKEKDDKILQNKSSLYASKKRELRQTKKVVKNIGSHSKTCIP